MTDAIAHNDYAFMKMYNKFFRTKEFMAFMRRAKSSTYYFLRASIIRESERIRNSIGHGAHASYKKFFLNGMLVGRYSIADIAEYSGTDKKAIRRDIKELEEAGFIKVLKIVTKTGVIINYYQLGTWEGKWGHDSYKEHYYLDDYFDTVYDKQRAIVETERKDNLLCEIMEVYTNFDYFMGVIGGKHSAEEVEHLANLWDKVHGVESIDFID